MALPLSHVISLELGLVRNSMTPRLASLIDGRSLEDIAFELHSCRESVRRKDRELQQVNARSSHLEDTISRWKARYKKLQHELDEVIDLTQAEVEDETSSLSDSHEASEREGTRAQNASFEQIPDEIWLDILRRPIPPTCFSWSSFSGSLDSAWCRSMHTKRSIVLVCKKWWRVGTAALYEDIVLFHIGQLAALARTVNENDDLSFLVKHLTFQCFVPSALESFFREERENLLRRCLAITHVTYDNLMVDNTGEALPPVGEDYVTQSRGADDPLSAIYRSCSSITTLYCGRVVDFWFLMQHLPNFTQLESLSLSPPENNPSPTEDQSIPHADMVWLTDLRICTSNIREHAAVCSTLEKYCRFPNLRRFIIDECIDPDFGWVEPFFRKHGANLQYLHFYPESSGCPPYLLLCPRLEHLVLRPWTHRNLKRCNHKTVKYVDLWRGNSLTAISTLRDLRSQITLEAFPSLQRVRIVDSNLSQTIEWPLLFPPTDDDELHFDYPGLRISVTAESIVMEEMVYGTDSPYLSAVEGDDSSFISTESETSTDTTWDSPDDDDDDDGAEPDGEDNDSTRRELLLSYTNSITRQQ